MLLLVFAAFFVLRFVFPSSARAFSVAFISDIHADGKKKTTTEGGSVIYPKKYKRCLTEVKNLKPDLIVAAGDLTDRGKKKYYEKLGVLTEGTPVLWAKGNHDDEDFQSLASKNYSYDYGSWRFIVLDTSGNFGSSTGFLDSSQISWLEERLETEKDVAIVMHHPPFFYNSRAGLYTSEKEHLYDRFFGVLTSNVKYVFSGHWHVGRETVLDGTTYLVQKALTQDGNCNYSFLELENNSSNDNANDADVDEIQRGRLSN